MVIIIYDYYITEKERKLNLITFTTEKDDDQDTQIISE